ncbi:MAG: glycosyltransferase family 9 protein [Candidatus Hydrogenedentota bacterium]
MGGTLVVHTGGIGDFILACPSIAQLAEDGPVDLLGQRERLALAVEGGIARVAYSLENVEFHSIFFAPSPKFREFLEAYSRAVVWMNDNDGRIRDSFLKCGVERVDVFPGLPPNDWQGHASDYYLSKLNLPRGTPVRFQFTTDGNDDVVIHPGSGGVAKNWPIENYLALADHLERTGHRVEWLVGPAERERSSAPRFPDALPEGPLAAVARRLAGARLYIGNDSGITHLAAAAGCNVVAIFGATDSRVWAPLGERVRVLGGLGRWPSVDEAIAACEMRSLV